MLTTLSCIYLYIINMNAKLPKKYERNVRWHNQNPSDRYHNTYYQYWYGWNCLLFGWRMSTNDRNDLFSDFLPTMEGNFVSATLSLSCIAVLCSDIHRHVFVSLLTIHDCKCESWHFFSSPSCPTRCCKLHSSCSSPRKQNEYTLTHTFRWKKGILYHTVIVP